MTDLCHPPSPLLPTMSHVHAFKLIYLNPSSWLRGTSLTAGDASTWSESWSAHHNRWLKDKGAALQRKITHPSICTSIYPSTHNPCRSRFGLSSCKLLIQVLKCWLAEHTFIIPPSQIGTKDEKKEQATKLHGLPLPRVWRKLGWVMFFQLGWNYRCKDIDYIGLLANSYKKKRKKNKLRQHRPA